jgi:hypothetical protein
MNLARATKQNLTDFFRFLARAPVAHYWEVEGIARWRTPVPHPWFNGCLLRRLPRAGDVDRLAHALEPFVQPARVPFTLWIEWDIPREPWRPVLETLGFTHDLGAPGMALALGDLPAQAALPPGFAIAPVTDDKTLRTWTETFVVAYELDPAWRDGLHALFHELGVQPPLAHFLGLLDGRPVATSSLFYSAGVVGVQFVATMPSVRRHGLGSLMTLQPLYAPHPQGIHAAVLQASEMGYNLYKELGFQHVANVDNEYRPEAPPAAHTASPPHSA